MGDANQDPNLDVGVDLGLPDYAVKVLIDHCQQKRASSSGEAPTEQLEAKPPAQKRHFAAKDSRRVVNAVQWNEPAAKRAKTDNGAHDHLLEEVAYVDHQRLTQHGNDHLLGRRPFETVSSVASSSAVTVARPNFRSLPTNLPHLHQQYITNEPYSFQGASYQTQLGVTSLPPSNISNLNFRTFSHRHTSGNNVRRDEFAFNRFVPPTQAHNPSRVPPNQALSNPLLIELAQIETKLEDSRRRAATTVLSARPSFDPNTVATLPSFPPRSGLQTRRQVSGIVKTLYQPEDVDSMSDFHCLARRHIEAFEATREDVEAGARGRNVRIVPGQVGIRCECCSHIPVRGRAKAGVFFPSKFTGVYQTAINMIALHLCESCDQMPKELRDTFLAMRAKPSQRSRGPGYWMSTFKKLGVIESPDGKGLRFADPMGNPGTESF